MVKGVHLKLSHPFASCERWGLPTAHGCKLTAESTQKKYPLRGEGIPFIKK